MQADEKIGLSTARDVGAIKSIHVRVRRAGHHNLKTGAGQLILKFLRQQLGIFFFFDAAGAFADVVSAVAGIKADGVDFETRFVRRWIDDWAERFVEIQLRHRQRPIAQGDWKRKAHRHAVDLRIGGIDRQGQARETVAEFHRAVAEPAHLKLIRPRPVLKPHIFPPGELRFAFRHPRCATLRLRRQHQHEDEKNPGGKFHGGAICIAAGAYSSEMELRTAQWNNLDSGTAWV